MKKMSDASKNIFRVFHIRIIAPPKNGSHDMKQTDSSIIIVRNVCVHQWLFIFSSRGHASTEQCTWAIISPKEFKSWVTRISFALLYGKNRIICCQIFCNLLLKSAFERNFSKWYARDPRFELFRGDYRSCALFSWWKTCRMQVKIYSVCTT
jgi:hypothetical protein